MNEQDKQKLKYCKEIKNIIWKLIDGLDEEAKLSVIANVLTKYIHSHVDKENIDRFTNWLSKAIAVIAKDDSNFNCEKGEYGEVYGNENHIIIEKKIN